MIKTTVSIDTTITINVRALITVRPIINPVLEFSSVDAVNNSVVTEIYKTVVIYDCIG